MVNLYQVITSSRSAGLCVGKLIENYDQAKEDCMGIEQLAQDHWNTVSSTLLSSPIYLNKEVKMVFGWEVGAEWGVVLRYKV